MSRKYEFESKLKKLDIASGPIILAHETCNWTQMVRRLKELEIIARYHDIFQLLQV